MTERLPAPADVLRGRTSGAASVSSDANGVVHQLLDLADRGNYLEAAARAADLLHGPVHDVRLIAIYLVGLFVERGAPALPEVLGCIETLGHSDPRALDSTLEWFARAVVDRVAFHTTRRDDAWESWLRALTLAEVEEIAARCDAIRARSPKKGAALQKLGRWAREKLLPAVARARKTAPPESTAPEQQPTPDPEPAPAPGWDAPDPEPSGGDEREQDESEEEVDNECEDESAEDDSNNGDEDDDEEEKDDDRADHAARRVARHDPHAHPNVVSIESPALADLRDKLQAFEIVLARGEFDKAAVIAQDVQTVLGNFDPIAYLPALFGRYSELLHASFSEIQSRWRETDSPKWQILVQFYRTNLAGFVGE